MRSPKNSIMRWLVFLRFFFPELSKTVQILFLLQLILFLVSIVLVFLHLDRLNFVGYFSLVALVCCMGMNYIQSNSFKM
ncbi:MAG: hypothetical protein CMG72_00525 [Candidatus Marinimicrobia bacterium]|nr:hypothetical protein [Candidatus Neomarinimicrobiota bacterium]